MKTLNDKLQTLSPAARDVVEGRAKELIAEELTLRQMRHALGLTQDELAKQLPIGQDNVSRLEQRDDIKLSTLRSYVEALGGELSLTVNFPDMPPIDLTGLSSGERPPNA